MKLRRFREKERAVAAYHFLVTLPDRLYPFRSEIQGKWVRGVRSYNQRLARAYKHYGRGHYGYALSLYRQAFHLAGSLVLIAAMDFFTAGFIFVVVVGGIGYQEFILQRRTYNQLWRKGIADWLVWCVPMGIYMWVHSH
ncbi:MAG: hypothetical protein RLZZ26_497 [Candidatus Parcubacteria bacterium]|jgi:hypothetical protein